MQNIHVVMFYEFKLSYLSSLWDCLKSGIIDFKVSSKLAFKNLKCELWYIYFNSCDKIKPGKLN